MTVLSRLGAVVLAAGQSRRMGGPNKLLRPFIGKPLVSHAFGLVGELALRDAIAVTGRDAVEVAEIAERSGVHTVHNPAFADGMGTSIACGVRALAPDVEGIFIVLADMPALMREDFERLAAELDVSRIVIPVSDGQRGHPVLFCQTFRSGLEQLHGDDGAKSIVRANERSVLELKGQHSRILFDCDTADDFLCEMQK